MTLTRKISYIEAWALPLLTEFDRGSYDAGIEASPDRPVARVGGLRLGGHLDGKSAKLPHSHLYLEPI